MGTKKIATEIKPGKNGYKIMYNENIIVMNYKFALAAGRYGSKEYKIMRGIRRDFPNMTEIIASGREQKSPRPNSRLTYENMEKHISVYDNAAELLGVFKAVKTASAAVRSPYKYVSDWFTQQFPDYKKAPVFKDGKLTAAPVAPPNVIDYPVKMEKAS